MSESQSSRGLNRRTLLKGALTAAALAAAAPRTMRAVPNAISPSTALQRLMDGNGRYMRNEMDFKDFSAGRKFHHCL